MTPEVSVERQFRFQCSCGATMVSGETTVTCTGCGAHLGIRKARRRRQRPDSVAYYGSTTLPVHRVERPRQEPNASAARPSTTRSSILSAWLKSVLARAVEPHRLPLSNELPRTVLVEGAHVKVGPTRPDGKPHPHAGKTGRITKFADAHSEPYWPGLPSAMIKLDPGIKPQGFIWVSLQALDALPEEACEAGSTGKP
jgi:hypothetical protein